MYLTQKKALVGEKPSRLQRRIIYRNAHEAHIQTNSAEQVDIAESEIFKTLFRRSWYLRDKTSN